MNTEPKPTPSLAQLQKAAESLLHERVLSKGGKQPSPQAVEMATRFMAMKALRHAQQKQSSEP